MRRAGSWAIGLVGFGAALAAAPAAAQSDLDEQRAAWSHRRAVAVPAVETGFVALDLPPELLARCRQDLADLRLVEGDGREVPYLLDRARERSAETRWSGALVDSRREQRRWSSWTLDLRAARSFDTLLLTIPEQDFAKAVRVELSEDGAGWREAVREAGVFDRPWSTRIHHTRIELPQPATARYVRLTLDDGRSRPVNVTGIEVARARPLPGESWSRPARVAALASEPGRSRYGLSGVAGLPFETLALEPDEAAFSRHVRVIEASLKNGRREETVLGEGEIYRLRADDKALAAEALSLSVRPPSGGELILEVRDDDSPPLRPPRATVSAAATRLLFAGTPGQPTLYYGNPLTRQARYDLESQRIRIAAALPFPGAELGPEQANPRFRAPLPLAFTPARGAALEARRWSRERVLAGIGREDLYTLTLAATDLAALRRDFADLRLVDESDSQVPFILEPAARAEKPELRIEAEPSQSPRGRALVSRHRLVMPELDGDPAALPLSALELEVAERFFSRPVRLLDPEAEGRRGKRVIAQAMLARSGREQGSLRPLEIAADGGRYREVVLEVEEGDNVPLRIERARAVVRVPRLAFKARPGQYRLLLGNEDIDPPRYDIASLSREFLTYSAIVIEAGPLAGNPGHRRRAAEYLKDAPPTLLLWGTLGVAVVALLLLTARILKQPTVPPAA